MSAVAVRSKHVALAVGVLQHGMVADIIPCCCVAQRALAAGDLERGASSNRG